MSTGYRQSRLADSRMLKKSPAAFSCIESPQRTREGYASGFARLRPRWTASLSILRKPWLERMLVT